MLTCARFQVLQPELLPRLPAEELPNMNSADVVVSGPDAETSGQQPQSIEQTGERA